MKTIPVVQSLRILELTRALQTLFDPKQLQKCLDILDIPASVAFDSDTDTDTDTDTDSETEFNQLPTVRQLAKKRDLRALLMDK